MTLNHFVFVSAIKMPYFKSLLVASGSFLKRQKDNEDA